MFATIALTGVEVLAPLIMAGQLQIPLALMVNSSNATSQLSVICAKRHY